MAGREDLTDEQWILIESLFEKKDEIQTRVRPARSARQVLDGVLRILRAGERWQDMPEGFPPSQTCHRRFQMWVKNGRLRSVLKAFAQVLLARGRLDLSGTFIDGTFVSAKEGAAKSERPSGGRIRSSWQLATSLIFLSPFTPNRLLPHGVRLAERTIRGISTDERPRQMIGDKAYDSDPLDKRLKKFEIDLIAPHKANRKRAKTRDGRKLGCEERRWKIARLFARMDDFRRIVARYKHHSDNYPGFVLLRLSTHFAQKLFLRWVPVNTAIVIRVRAH